jgi:uncharacterized protein (DUF1015 family)
VAALPYDTFSRQEAATEIAAQPRSFLRIDKSCALFPDDTDEYAPEVYAKAAELFADDRCDGVYAEDGQAHYFLYRLEKNGRSQVGIAACIAAADYRSGLLKRHESTRSFKLKDRIRHITALGAQTGPVFVTYRARPKIDQAVNECMAGSRPLYDFVSLDGVRHSIWRVDDPGTHAAIQDGFASLDAMYIADGHHRAAAAVAVGETAAGGADSRAAAVAADEIDAADVGAAATDGSSPISAAAASHFLIIAFPAEQLQILDYNRVVFDRNGLSAEQLLERIGAAGFAVRRIGGQARQPSKRGEFTAYLDGCWYLLTVDEGLRSADPVHGLDVSLLHDCLLAPILGIDDPRSSKRIAYVGGVRGLDELQGRADGTGGVAFALYPCTMDELFAVADAGELMPPKSTWFEPKPRSGLLIHRIAADAVEDAV